MSEAISATAPRSRRGGARILFLSALLGILGLLALLAYGLRERSAPPLAAGVPPDFEMTTFDGQHIKLSELKGKGVIVNFWASWCIPCRDEAASLEKAWQSYHERGLVVIGVDYVDTDPEAKKFIAEFNQTFPNGPDLGTKISQQYRISGVPETYFIGKDGRLLPGIDTNGHPNGNWIGPVPDDALNSRIQQMLSM